MEYGIYASGSQPLSLSRRIKRGFNRAGLIIGVLLALFAAGIAGTIAFGKYSEIVGKREQAQCLMRAIKSGNARASSYGPANVIDVQASGCPGWYLSRATKDDVTFAALMPVDYSEVNSILLVGSAATAGTIIASYVFFMLLGWVAAGFTRDPD